MAENYWNGGSQLRCTIWQHKTNREQSQLFIFDKPGFGFIIAGQVVSYLLTHNFKILDADIKREYFTATCNQEGTLESIVEDSRILGLQGT